MQNTLKRRRTWWIVGLAVIPWAVAAIFVISVGVIGLFRYDPSYFTEIYRERYFSPGAAAVGLETAIRTGDHDLLAELQGLRWQQPDIEPRMGYSALLMDSDDQGYFNYLYYNPRTFDRELHAVRKVRERWVVVPDDPFYYLESGKWWTVFGPLAAGYYAIYIVVVSGTTVYHLAARYREERYGWKTRP